MVINQYDSYALSTRYASIIQEIKEMKLMIDKNEAWCRKVYGTCKDGSYEMSLSYNVMPLYKELYELECKRDEMEAWNAK